MVKESPSIARLLAMTAFAASCVGILLFLWISFGGSVPLQPKEYTVKANFPEAATLVEEADVRIAGVNVGKVKKRTLDKGANRTTVTMEIQPQYGPIPKDTKAILRSKTLLGETYVELSNGNPKSGKLKDGSTLANNKIEGQVQLDEIFNAFDKPTRVAFQQWVGELAKATKGNGGRDLNDSFGNLSGFAVDGSKLLTTLDDQDVAVRRLVKNTGVVFGAVNQREGALRGLVQNANNTFEATASRDRALADTIRVFPTFLDESKATLRRLDRFSANTRPLVNQLKPVADDLGPTVRNLGDLSPDLSALFRDLNPLIRAGDKGLPDLTSVLKGAQPLVEATHAFFPELNPILAVLNYHQATVAGFLAQAAPDLNSQPAGQRVQSQIVMPDIQSLLPGGSVRTRPPGERGNAYLAPNTLMRSFLLGGIESFDCKPSGGEQRDPVDVGAKSPPCFVSPPSLFNNKRFVLPGKGNTTVRVPKGTEGNAPDNPNR